LEKKLIVVLGNKSYGEPFTHLGKISTSVVDIFKDKENIQLVVFTGGEDVHPSFYGGVDRGISYHNIRRDMYEKKVFDFCTQHNIKCTGICRGAQILDVMCGGSMYQHIRNHTRDHIIIYPALNRKVFVTSTHHQLVGLAPDAVPIAWADPRKSDIYIGPNCEKVNPPKHEIEAAVYPKFNALGVQFHPEFMRNSLSGKILYRKMAKDFLKNSMEAFIDLYGVKKSGAHNNLLTGDICHASAS